MVGKESNLTIPRIVPATGKHILFLTHQSLFMTISLLLFPVSTGKTVQGEELRMERRTWLLFLFKSTEKIHSQMSDHCIQLDPTTENKKRLVVSKRFIAVYIFQD